MSETPLSRLPDGAALRVLAGGITIVRYMKHEWVSGLDQLPPDRLLRKTNKVYGSKFNSSWTLDRLVNWMGEQIEENGWALQAGARYRLDVRLPEVVGLVDAREVHTIRIVSDGRYAHAYPVEDS